MNEALGLIEVIGLTQAIVAADAAVKSANVNILGIEKVTGGIVTVKIVGDVSAVTAAVEGSRSMIEHSGNLRSSHVISRLDKEVLSIINDIEPKNMIFANQLCSDKEQSNTIIETEEEVMVEQLDVEVQEVDIVENLGDKEQIIMVDFKRDELLKMTVKDLRRLALTLRPSKTSNKIKYLKKEELVALLLKLSKEEGRN
ncbi:MAG: BMC domain-containing protein [Clostridium sp.]|uniref:BMC domain-containing protein n=1 Tax=Clostridium sp. TaxID=1506 RepID=UPI003F32174C